MSRIYWTLGRISEHPAKTRMIDYVDSKLSDHACQGFRTKLELAKSIFFGDVIIAEEDPAPIYEVVLFVGDNSTEQREGSGVEGIFVECMQIEERHRCSTGSVSSRPHQTPTRPNKRRKTSLSTTMSEILTKINASPGKAGGFKSEPLKAA